MELVSSGSQSTTGRLAILAAVVIGERLLASAVDFDGSSYARNVSLDADLDVFWTVDDEAETIHVAVHAKDATGWVGVGTSEMGGMEGADIVFYEAASGEITDAYSLVAGTPLTDECTQDWTLLSADLVDRSLVFEAERALDTGDAQDRVFVDDTADGTLPTTLIAAWGDSETISYHGIQSAKGAVVVFGGEDSSDVDPLRELKSNPGVSFFDVTTRNFTIPTIRTHYEFTCLPASALPDLEEFHVVGFEGVAETGTSKYVHHLVARGYRVPDCGIECLEWEFAVAAAAAENSTTFLEAPSNCSQIDYTTMYAWTPGVNGVAMPEEAGFRFGNSSGRFASVMVNTHYDNPNGDAGVLDSSGVRVYYTETLRPMDMGMIILGDPLLGEIGKPISGGKTSFSFGCPSSCTEEHFEVKNVTLFSHFLHMHENGRRIQTRQYRNDSSGNEVLVHTAEVEYFSFEQAGGHTTYTDGTVTIQKGDRFETECFYDTVLSSVGSENVSFGVGSADEMCMDFVTYYPTQSILVTGSCGPLACGGALLESVELAADSDFNRTFAVAAATCATDEEAVDLSASSRVTVTGIGFSAGAAVVWLIAVPLIFLA